MLQVYFFPLLFPISQPSLPTVSHLGPGNIHPDGGFIFVFVCLLIYASSYSGHHWGFCSTTECKSPPRLIHFHLSLVDIQLGCMFLSVSPGQDISLLLYVWSGLQWPGQSSTSVYFLNVKYDPPFTFHLPLPILRHASHSPDLPYSVFCLTLTPNRQ